jgi:DNA-binding HxlR family transcriptional regulator
MLVKTTYVIRQLVEKALYIRQLTPDIENEINYELTRMGTFLMLITRHLNC